MMQRLPCLVIVVALLAAACGADSESQGSAGGGGLSGSLRVGFSGLPDYTGIMNFVWLENLREQRGVDAEDVIFDGTAPPFRALAAGEVDMVVGQVPPGVLLRKETGAEISMIAGDVRSSDYLLLSQQDITELTDLYGQQIGTAGPEAVSQTLVVAALEREGIDLDQIEFVEVGGGSARRAALKNGDIPAAAVHAAEGFQLIEESGLTNLFNVAEAVGPYLFHGVWASKEWLEENPDLAQVAVDEFIESVRWAAANKEEYVEKATETLEGLSEGARVRAYDFFQEVGLFAVDGGLSPELVDATIAIEQETGNLPADIPEPSEWVDDRFVKDYLKRNGSQGGS